MITEFKTICYPFLCLSYHTQAPLQPKRPHKVCGICCCSEIRRYSNLRVWYCILCCECKHPNHERCCECVKSLQVTRLLMWKCGKLPESEIPETWLERKNTNCEGQGCIVGNEFVGDLCLDSIHHLRTSNETSLGLWSVTISIEFPPLIRHIFITLVRFMVVYSCFIVIYHVLLVCYRISFYYMFMSKRSLLRFVLVVLLLQAVARV